MVPLLQENVDLVDSKYMRALSIRQPYAGLIPRGIKTAELLQVHRELDANDNLVPV